LRRAFLVQAWPLGVEDDLENQASSLVMAAGIHGAGAQRPVMQVPRSLRFASAVVAVDPPECLSKDLAMGLPESSSSVAAVELRRSPSWRDAPDLRLPRPETTKSNRDLVESKPHICDPTAKNHSSPDGNRNTVQPGR